MKKTVTIDPNSISTQSLHGYLLAAVAPRPIALASTIDKDGNVNLSPFSFFNVFSANPPIMIFSPARRARDNTTKHTYENIKAVPEVVINIVNFPMVEQVSLSSTEYDKGVNEFVKAGFTAIKSDLIQPPRVGEAPVAFECKVEQVIELGDQGGAGNLVLAKVVSIHIREEYLDADKKLDTLKLDLVARMGANYYCHADANAIFTIPKPIFNKGIGIDQLPMSARNSDILSGNNLGRLGNIENPPSSESLALLKKEDEIKEILLISDENEQRKKFHLLAKKYLEAGNTEKALAILSL